MKSLKFYVMPVLVSLIIILAYIIFSNIHKLSYTSLIPTWQPVPSDFAGKDIKIYRVYHKDAPIFQNDIVTPILAGRALHTQQGKNLENIMIGDDTGDNISLKNKTFAELTVIYWMWKNIEADYVGLLHYRRDLDLGNQYFRCSDYLCAIGANRINLSKKLDIYDIILPKEGYIGSIYKQYIDNHLKEDIDTAIDYIKNKYPEMNESIDNVLYEKSNWHCCNVFIMKKEILNEYATWLFDILFAIEPKLDYALLDTKTKGFEYTNNNDYQIRAPGFLAERLFNIWIFHNRNKYRIGRFDLMETPVNK